MGADLGEGGVGPIHKELQNSRYPAEAFAVSRDRQAEDHGGKEKVHRFVRFPKNEKPPLPHRRSVESEYLCRFDSGRPIQFFGASQDYLV